LNFEFCKEKETFFKTFRDFKTILKNKWTFIENIHDINETNLNLFDNDNYLHINENICEFLHKNVDLTELFENKIKIIDEIVDGLMLTKDEKIKYYGQIELSKTDENASKVDNFALKCVFLEQKLIFLEFIALNLSFWVECRNRVKEVRPNKLDEHCDLRLSTNAQKCLESFLKMGEVSNRGKSQIIDIATTAALLDRK